jgi:hypothetical protein
VQSKSVSTISDYDSVPPLFLTTESDLNIKCFSLIVLISFSINNFPQYFPSQAAMLLRIDDIVSGQRDVTKQRINAPTERAMRVDPDVPPPGQDEL